MPQIHASQIQGTDGFQSLFDQLKAIDSSTTDVDVEYTYALNGDITGEVVWDMSDPTKPVEIKSVTYTYDSQGSIAAETLKVGGATYEKTYVFLDGVVVKESVRKKTVTV